MRKTAIMAMMLAAGLSGPTVAKEVDKTARCMAANCAYCHGPDGRSTSAIPPLAGMPKERFVDSMKALKYGKRPGIVMHQIAAGYTDAEIDAMGAWFADIK